MKQRIRRLIIYSAVLLLVGVAYAVFYTRTGIGIPCPLRFLTGLKCPGCGVTRMCISLLRGNFSAAWQYNPVLLCLLPLFLFLGIQSIISYLKSGRVAFSRRVNFLIYCMIAVLLIFFLVRNITEHHFAALPEHFLRFFACIFEKGGDC